LPFGDRSFDRVLSLLVLHFVPQTERAVAELRRVARPGATVAAAVWDVRGGYVANRIFYDTAAAFDEEGRKRRAHNYTRPMTRPGELAAARRAAGFTNVRDTALHIRMEFSAFDDSGCRLRARTVRAPNILRRCRPSGGIVCAIWSATRTSTAKPTARGPMPR